MNARFFSLQALVCVLVALIATACSPSSSSESEHEASAVEMRLDRLERELREEAKANPEIPKDHVRIGDLDRPVAEAQPATPSVLAASPESSVNTVPFDETEPTKSERSRHLVLDVPDPSRDTEPVANRVVIEHDEESNLSVVDRAMAAHVEHRAPKGQADTFDLWGKRKTLWAWVKVANNGTQDSAVTMVWRHQGKERSRIDLNVGVSKGWRTWSKKTVSPRDAGLWSVEVYNPEGDRLSTMNFTVKSSDPSATSQLDADLEEIGCSQ